MKKVFVSLILTIISFALNSAWGQCPLKFKGSNASTVGIYIEDIANGKTTTYESNRTMTPASILKSLTCATALRVLGTDYRFKTDFYLISDTASSGNYNLVVKASADPTMGSREFKESGHLPDSVASALAALGVKNIGGDIVIDGSVLPKGGGIVPQWEVEDVTESYGVGLYPLNWMDNYFESDYIIPSPQEYFKELLTQSLAMNDIGIDGNVLPLPTDSVTADTLHVLTHNSAPLGDIMRSLMVRSDNLMAEGTLRALMPYATRDSAITFMKDYWLKNGVDLTFTRILDGNGLSRGNALSAAQMGHILTAMAKSKYSSDYVALFPRAGKEGTVKSFMRGSRLEGHLAVKSGSMSGVHCYAGYRLDRKGNPTHTVVVMVNNFYCSRYQLRKAIENYLLTTLPK